MYRLITAVTGAVVDAFYRRIVLGDAVPADRPVLLVANHPNALVDPIVVARATTRRVRMLAKAPLFRMPVLSLLVRGMDALPVYRKKDGADPTLNAETFRAVERALCDGSCVLVFPEGTSHDEPQVQPLRTGAARIALGAAAAGAKDLCVVPIGLVYRDKLRFRSEVATFIGAPLEVTPFLAPRGERAATDASAAPSLDEVRALTDAMSQALRDVTLNLERWEDLPLLEAIDAVLEGASETPAALRAARIHALAKAVERARVEDPAGLEAVRARVQVWTRRLARLGLSPADLSPVAVEARSRPIRALRLAALAGLRAIVGFPLATFGFLAFVVPFLVNRLLYALIRPSLNRGATVKLLGALVLFPTWFVALCVALWTHVGPMVAVIVGLTAPPCGLMSRWYFRTLGQTIRDVLIWLRLVPRRRLQGRLVADRDAVIAAVGALWPGRDASTASDRPPSRATTPSMDVPG